MTVQEALQLSAEELGRRAEAHRRLLARALEGREAALDVCPLADCPHRRVLRETLLNAVEVLEDTRRAFKSKKLEALRKGMIEVLAESS
jgi:hypothetical protein